ncbi:PfaD family polyunsaturated fatty acid/polyketide biosynthesis protein [Aliikangiella maris]|uniref:PfaD family polyunsaturated fatty acid/polyketide biosynthesis protein n=2 Tax=Aliikangiella maris TaxID=3162458 RepID=A0ABV3MPJ5_9GAMM
METSVEKKLVLEPGLVEKSAQVNALVNDSVAGQNTVGGLSPEKFGAPSFRHRYQIKYAYLTGAMYRGIASKALVVAVAKAGFLGFLGTGGMSLAEIEENIVAIQQALNHGAFAFGMNLLANIHRPEQEMQTVELYLKKDIQVIEAASFTQVTPALVYYRLAGVAQDEDGTIICKNKIIGKLSRPEVASAFLSPPPPSIVNQLLRENKITAEQARLAEQILVCDDICVEADSGGHTDQGIASVLLSAMLRLRDEVYQKYTCNQPIHIGLAGGIGAPPAVVAAFMMGADFILTGSINQCTVESGANSVVKSMLQEINVQDTDYAPAGDMFEIGAKVQVLKKGVLFPSRANKLVSLYHQYGQWENVPLKMQQQIEQKYFQKTFEQVWQQVKAYRVKKNQQASISKAENNPKYKMALVIKWYFAYSNILAFNGDLQNQVDFQVHTGPALGAFNQWVKGTALESWQNRHVGEIGELLMQASADLASAQIKKLLD